MASSKPMPRSCYHVCFVPLHPPSKPYIVPLFSLVFLFSKKPYPSIHARLQKQRLRSCCTCSNPRPASCEVLRNNMKAFTLTHRPSYRTHIQRTRTLCQLPWQPTNHEPPEVLRNNMKAFTLTHRPSYRTHIQRTRTLYPPLLSYV
jgi:hypothetical protein